MQMRKLKLPYVGNLCKVTRSVSGCPPPPGWDSCTFYQVMLLPHIDKEEGDSVQNGCRKQAEETGWPRVAPVPGSVGAYDPAKGPRPWRELRKSSVMGWG